MLKVFFLMSAIILSTTASAFVKKTDLPVDRRVELIDYHDHIVKEYAKSTLVLMNKTDVLKIMEGKKTSTLLERGFSHYPNVLLPFSYKVFPCNDMRFVKQPSIGHCTGFLVANNILMTAGHCVSEVCDSSKVWVKDFSYDKKGNINITKDDIFSCEQILDRKLELPTPVYYRTIDPRFEDMTPDEIDYSKTTDYAVIEIGQNGKKFKNSFLTISRSLPTVGDPLVMIGAPLGMPTKVTDNGTVLENRLDRVIITDLDAFKGNSGGPVINLLTGRVEGILVRTGPSVIKKDNDSCFNILMSSPEEIATNEFSELTPINLIPNLNRYLSKENDIP